MRINAIIRFGCRVVLVVVHRLKRARLGHFVELGKEGLHFLILSNFLFEALKREGEKKSGGEVISEAWN